MGLPELAVGVDMKIVDNMYLLLSDVMHVVALHNHAHCTESRPGDGEPGAGGAGPGPHLRDSQGL